MKTTVRSIFSSSMSMSSNKDASPSHDSDSEDISHGSNDSAKFNSYDGNTVLMITKPKGVPSRPLWNKPTIVDWNILGSVQAVRLSLVLAEVEFVDVRLEAGNPASNDYKKVWDASLAKSLLEPHFLFSEASLPYFMDTFTNNEDPSRSSDGKTVITLSQSDSILRHIGRTYKIMGEEGMAHVVDEALDQLSTMEGILLSKFYYGGKDKCSEWCRIVAPSKLEKWRSFLASQPYLTGSKPSVADMKLFVFLYKLNIIERGCVLPKWARYMERIEEIPQLKEYMSTPSYMLKPSGSFSDNDPEQLR